MRGSRRVRLPRLSSTRARGGTGEKPPKAMRPLRPSQQVPARRSGALHPALRLRSTSGLRDSRCRLLSIGLPAPTAHRRRPPGSVYTRRAGGHTNVAPHTCTIAHWPGIPGSFASHRRCGRCGSCREPLAATRRRTSSSRRRLTSPARPPGPAAPTSARWHWQRQCSPSLP